nr:50S ribosomal protein L5P [uncultured archaeon]
MAQKTVKKSAPVIPSAANPMRSVFIEKVIVSAGAIAENLVKSKKLLELVTGKKAQIITTSKRIPDFNVRPGLEVGTRVRNPRHRIPKRYRDSRI